MYFQFLLWAWSVGSIFRFIIGTPLPSPLRWAPVCSLSDSHAPGPAPEGGANLPSTAGEIRWPSDSERFRVKDFSDDF